MPPRKAPTGLLAVRGAALARGAEAVVAESRNLVEEWKNRLVVLVGVVVRRREVVEGLRRTRMLLGARSLDSIVKIFANVNGAC